MASASGRGPAFWRGWSRRSRRALRWGTVVAAALATATAGGLYWDYQVHHPSTDDAYVHAHVVRIAPRVTGQAVAVAVSDQQTVEKGQVLFRIDPRPFEYGVRQAEAKLALARQTVEARQAAVAAARAEVRDRRVQLENARTHYHRIQTLAKGSVSSQSDLDDARARLRSAEAGLELSRAKLHQARVELGEPGEANDRVQDAQAALDRARLDLEHTRVTAPCAGRISGLELRPGDPLRAQEPQFALVCDARWVYANFKETDLGRIRPGQVATVHVDLYPDRTFHGIVESLSPASGSAFSLLPPQNATGNWVKVTQRVPVRILLVDAPPEAPLRVQTSAEVRVDTGSAPTPLGHALTRGLSDAEAMAIAQREGLVRDGSIASRSPPPDDAQ